MWVAAFRVELQRAAAGIGSSRHARAVLWEYGRGCTDVRLWLLAGERADIVRAGKFIGMHGETA